ncbi:MAG: hypothetical protein PHE27_09235 [Alphaproteobacteria bacterium]|nr:hypothetical protein [Alphaproteobacteria bacterium]
MSVINKAFKAASAKDDPKAGRTVQIFSREPAFNPLDCDLGDFAAETAVALFDSNHLKEFSAYIAEKKLTPNIVLPSGITLLQHSLINHPKDETRLKTLLNLGANPNIFMPPATAPGQTYRPAFHPLNHTFTNFPETFAASTCLLLRTYGASAEAIKRKTEKSPTPQLTGDSVEKAALRKQLVETIPDINLVKQIRYDSDLSLLHKQTASLEQQMQEAGIELINECSQKKKPSAPQKILTSADIGKNIKGKGIYFGRWSPVDRKGKSIGKTYDVFAAPEDLPDHYGKRALLMFNDAAREVAKLKNWHGFDGCDYENDEELYNNLRYGSYKGQWFIPTIDLLYGLQNISGQSQINNLFALRDTDDFKGTFETNEQSTDSKWYWSCTWFRQLNTDHYSTVYTGNFSKNDIGSFTKDYHKISTRLCRAELVGAAAPAPA